MDNSAEVRDFLSSRRAGVTPAQAGLPDYGGTRRVPGLRREELAMLAGMSVDYYTRLERGNLRGVSDGVLEALARVLLLDDAERTYLFDLARTASRGADPVRRARGGRGAQGGGAAVVRVSVQRTLDAMTGAPAYVRNNRFDVLASNRLGRALYAPLFDSVVSGGNTARFLFLDAAAADFYRDWSKVARDCVAVLRAQAGHTPYDQALSGLVGELSTRSEEFGVMWAAHRVRAHRTGTKRLRHPVVGELDLTGEALELPGEEVLTMITYTVEPGSPSADALGFLSSWAEEKPRPAAVDAPADGERRA